MWKCLYETELSGETGGCGKPVLGLYGVYSMVLLV